MGHNLACRPQFANFYYGGKENITKFNSYKIKYDPLLPNEALPNPKGQQHSFIFAHISAMSTEFGGDSHCCTHHMTELRISAGTGGSISTMCHSGLVKSFKLLVPFQWACPWSCLGFLQHDNCVLRVSVPRPLSRDVLPWFAEVEISANQKRSMCQMDIYPFWMISQGDKKFTQCVS